MAGTKIVADKGLIKIKCKYCMYMESIEIIRAHENSCPHKPRELTPAERDARVQAMKDRRGKKRHTVKPNAGSVAGAGDAVAGAEDAVAGAGGSVSVDLAGADQTVDRAVDQTVGSSAAVARGTD